MIDLEMWRNIGIALAGITGGVGLYIGQKKSDGKPPPERPISSQDLLKLIDKVREEVLEMIDETDDRSKDRHLEIVRLLNQLSWDIRTEKALQDIQRAYPPRSKEQ